MSILPGAATTVMTTLRIAVMGIVLTSCHGPAAIAQPTNYTTKDKKAIKLLESGGDCMRQRKWACAEADLKKAATIDPSFIEPRIYLAEMYEEQDRAAEAISYWTEVVAISPKYFPPAPLHLAELEFAAQRYDDAEKHYRLYLSNDDEPMRVAKARLGSAEL